MSRSPIPSHWANVRVNVLARDGWRCQLRLPGCTGHATQVDHIVPRSIAPWLAADPANCRAACFGCNNRRGTTPDDQLPRKAPASRAW